MSFTEVFVLELVFVDFFETIQMELADERFGLLGVEKFILFAEANVLQLSFVYQKAVAIADPFDG